MGKVPQEWTVCRIKNIADLNPSKSEVSSLPADKEVSFLPENLKFCLGQRMMNFIPFEPEYKNFLFDFLLSDCLERYIERVSHGSTVTHLRVEQVENIPVIVPLKDEAEAIHNYLGGIKSKYEKLTLEAENAIALMQEHRTALISAAVTGKIDVREWSAPDSVSQQKQKKQRPKYEQGCDKRSRLSG